MNEKILYRANRFFAWLLIPVLTVNFVTGYAAIHPRLFGALIPKPRAFRAHMAIQPLTAALVLFHALYHVRLVLGRRGLRGAFVDGILAVLWLAGTAAACWLARLG